MAGRAQRLCRNYRCQSHDRAVRWGQTKGLLGNLQESLHHLQAHGRDLLRDGVHDAKQACVVSACEHQDSLSVQ
jgi:hypothetical protein